MQESQYTIEIKGPDGAQFTCEVWIVEVAGKVATPVQIKPKPTPEQLTDMRPAITEAVRLILAREGHTSAKCEGTIAEGTLSEITAGLRRHFGGGIG